MKIKICCIASKEEAHNAISAGADALGLVSAMPSGPGVIDEQTIKEIAESVPEEIKTFLLTCLTDFHEIIAQIKRCGTNTVQLVDDVDINCYKKIKDLFPQVDIVQVLHVTGLETIEKAIKLPQEVDAILLDSGNPNLAVKELGGTGRVHNTVNKPVYLAGGLNPDNVLEAINKVKPYGVDICSGIRTNGELDILKLKLYIDRIKSLK